MRVEFEVSKAGLWFSALGVGLHVEADGRAAGEPLAWWAKPAPGSRLFRLGSLSGAVSLQTR